MLGKTTPSYWVVLTVGGGPVAADPLAIVRFRRAAAAHVVEARLCQKVF
jgi:hypothetical protein